jgi:hypothetical protein
MTVVRNDVSAWPWPGGPPGTAPAPLESTSQGVAQGNYLHVGRVGHVQCGNDAGEALQVVRVIGDHQRVVAGIDVDGVVGADQRAQDGHQVAGRLVVQPENLGDDLVARHRGAGGHGSALQLGIGFGHELEQATRFHHREARQAQCRQELVVGHRRRDRPVGAEIDRALDPRIDHDVAPGDGRHGARHRLDIGIDEVQGDGFARSLGMGDARPASRCERASHVANQQSFLHVSLW